MTKVATVDNHLICGERWVNLKVHGTELTAWLKPSQAAELGRFLIEQYSGPAKAEETAECGVRRW